MFTKIQSPIYFWNSLIGCIDSFLPPRNSQYTINLFRVSISNLCWEPFSMLRLTQPSLYNRIPRNLNLLKIFFSSKSQSYTMQLPTPIFQCFSKAKLKVILVSLKEVLVNMNGFWFSSNVPVVNNGIIGNRK